MIQDKHFVPSITIIAIPCDELLRSKAIKEAATIRNRLVGVRDLYLPSRDVRHHAKIGNVSCFSAASLIVAWTFSGACVAYRVPTLVSAPRSYSINLKTNCAIVKSELCIKSRFFKVQKGRPAKTVQWMHSWRRVSLNWRIEDVVELVMWLVDHLVKQSKWQDLVLVDYLVVSIPDPSG